MTDRAEVGRIPLVILPTYNEAENIVQIVHRIRETLPQAHIWIIDDNSPDGTGALADRLAAEDGDLRVTHRPGKLGLGTAYAEAFSQVMNGPYDAVIQMDSDFSHDPDYLPHLLCALKGADVVIGSRYIAGGGTQNWSRLREGISRTGNRVARIGLGVRVHDATGGYRAFRPEALRALNYADLRLRGYGFQVEVVYQLEQMGLSVREVPITFVERAAGTSKMSKGIVAEAALHILRRRLQRMRRALRSPHAVRLG